MRDKYQDRMTKARKLLASVRYATSAGADTSLSFLRKLRYDLAERETNRTRR